MDRVKLAPLRGTERAQDRVIQQARTGAEAFFASCKRLIHLGEMVECFRQDLGAVLPSGRANMLRSFTPLRKLAHFNDPKNRQPLLELEGSSIGLACGEHSAEAFRSAAVGQGEMLQYFGGGPLPFRVLAPLIGGHTLGDGE